MQLDPMGWLIYHLHERFAPLGEETLEAVADMMSFHRRSGESIDSMIARFLAIMHRAARNGSFMMTPEGYAVMLMRAAGVMPDQRTILLAPLQGRLPNT